MIVDDCGGLVWFNAIGNRELATDFRVQTLPGKPVLTWWQGRLIGGEGRGEGVIYDTRYRPVRRVRAGNGLQRRPARVRAHAAGHRAAARSTTRSGATCAASAAPKGVVVQAVVQEIDIATGLVLFEWHSLGNVGLSESHERVPEGSGAVGLRARQLGRARRATATSSSPRATRRRATDLARERPDPVAAGRRALGLPDGGGHALLDQHDARPQPDGTLTLFDNSAPPPQRKASRAITLRLDRARKTATLVQALKHPENLLSADPGRRAAAARRRHVRRLGLAPLLHRVRRRGARRARRRASPPAATTTAPTSFPWSGRPARPPALVASRRGNRVAARVSWNGATGVASWELWAGSSANALRRVKGQPHGGFETAISARHARALRPGPGARRRRGGTGGERDDPDRFVRALTPGFSPAIFLTIWPLR